jgi:DNA transformation protein
MSKAKIEYTSFEAFVMDQLKPLRELEARRMFGCWGLYLKDTFFGILDDNKLYFKTSPETSREYKALGSQPFTYQKRDAHGRLKTVGLINYYQVPVDIMEDQTRFMEWAKIAVCVNLKKSEKTDSRKPRKNQLGQRKKYG